MDHTPISSNSVSSIIWTKDGIPINTANNTQGKPQIINCGSGGAIFILVDLRGRSSTELDVYVQRINSSGVPQWTPNGTAISTEQYHQKNPQFTFDGAENIIIVWDDDLKHDDSDIFIQKINATGDI